MNLSLFIFSVILLEVLSITATDIFVPFTGSIIADLGQSSFLHSGDLVGLAIFGEGLGAIFWGSIFDRYGSRRTLVPGCLFFLAASAAVSVSTDPFVFGLSRFFQGCSRSLVFTAGYTTLRTLLKERSYVSLLNMMTVMVVLVPALSIYGGAVAARSGFQNWRIVSWGITAVSLLIFVLFYRILPNQEKKPSAGQPLGRTLISCLGLFRKNFWTFIAYALFNIPSIAWVGFLSVLYDKNPGHAASSPVPGTDVPSDLSLGFHPQPLVAFGEQVLGFPHHVFNSLKALLTRSTAFLSPEELGHITTGSNLLIVIAVAFSGISFSMISKIKRLKLKALREISVAALAGGFLLFWGIPRSVGFSDSFCLVYFLCPFMLICMLEDPVISLYEASVLLDDDSDAVYGMRMGLATVFADAIATLYLHFDDFFIDKSSNQMALFTTGIGLLLFFSYRMSIREQKLAANDRAGAAGA